MSSRLRNDAFFSMSTRKYISNTRMQQLSDAEAPQHPIRCKRRGTVYSTPENRGISGAALNRNHSNVNTVTLRSDRNFPQSRGALQ
jgi:hypothetical protein